MMVGIAINNTTIFVIYNIVSTTCFGHFLTGHHQVGIQYQRNYIPTIIQSLVSVSAKKGGTRSRLQEAGRVCRLWWKLDTCIDHVGIACPYWLVVLARGG